MKEVDAEQGDAATPIALPTLLIYLLLILISCQDASMKSNTFVLSGSVYNKHTPQNSEREVVRQWEVFLFSVPLHRVGNFLHRETVR